MLITFCLQFFYEYFLHYKGRARDLLGLGLFLLVAANGQVCARLEPGTSLVSPTGAVRAHDPSCWAARTGARGPR